MIRLMLAAVAALAVSAACAQPIEPSVRAQARTIESQVWSPYCPGRLLSDCTTRQAFELRTRIEDRLEAGDTPDAVLAWLRANYGDEVLARPAADRRGLAIWAVPALLFTGGAGIVLAAVRRWRRTEPAAEPPPDGTRWTAEIRDEVRRDL